VLYFSDVLAFVGTEPKCFGHPTAGLTLKQPETRHRFYLFIYSYNQIITLDRSSDLFLCIMNNVWD
jgi:hypothetical protein